ncbi:MAG: hypothetical protein JJ974_01480 [Phycisphaerales bacterium]|nr:hypothetical protein [Phycisphaerales bacterium]
MNTDSLNMPLSGVVKFALLALAIAVVVSLMIPVESHGPAVRPPIQWSLGQARTLVQGAFVFAGEHDDRFPSKEEWPGALIELGIIEHELLISRVENGGGYSFVYVPSTHQAFDPGYENRIMVYENPDHYEEGVVVGFADARAEIIAHEEFERMLAQQLGDQESTSETP